MTSTGLNWLPFLLLRAIRDKQSKISTSGTEMPFCLSAASPRVFLCLLSGPWEEATLFSLCPNDQRKMKSQGGSAVGRSDVCFASRRCCLADTKRSLVSKHAVCLICGEHRRIPHRRRTPIERLEYYRSSAIHFKRLSKVPSSKFTCSLFFAFMWVFFRNK